MRLRARKPCSLREGLKRCARAAPALALSTVLILALPGCTDKKPGKAPRGRPSPRRSSTGPAAVVPARPAARIVVDEKARTVTVPAAVAKQAVHDVLKGAIEYVLVAQGGKDYETVFATEFPAGEIYAALTKIGLSPGSPAAEDAPPKGKPVEILVVYKAGGTERRRPVDEFVTHIKTKRPLSAAPWTFTGSATTTDPESGKQVRQASLTGSIIGLHYSDPSPLFQNPRPEGKEDNIYTANLEVLPPAGTVVQVVFRRVMRKLPEGFRRVRVVVAGRVQGVGFRAFTQRRARMLKLTGFVRNLADGRVEAVIEGQSKSIDELVLKLRSGPRAARVADVQVKEELPEGDMKDFGIRR